MPELVVLADHPLAETLPFFGPVVPIVAFLVFVTVRDRRRERREHG